MNHVMEIRIRTSDLPEFRRVILGKGICRLFLPASFVIDGETTFEITDIAGYCALNDTGTWTAAQALRSGEHLLQSMKEAQDHFMFPGEYYIGGKGIFCGGSGAELSLAFLPYKYGSRRDTIDAVCSVLMEINQHVDPEGRGYMEEVIRLIQVQDPGISAAIHLLKKMGREAKLVGL